MARIPPDPVIERLASEAQAQQEAMRAALEEARERARVYQLAFWPDHERAMPGDFIACALFTASRATAFVTRSQLASINGLSVLFTGKRLTQVHADVWMGIMHLARQRREGDVVWFRDRQLLELIGRHTHQGQREQLKDWLSQLTATEVLVQDDVRGRRFGGSLLPWRVEADADGNTIYAVDISRELAKLLSERQPMIDWELRKRLQNKPLALWLQTYFARFSKPVSVAQLHALSGSTAQLKEFRRKLTRALKDLQVAGGPSAGIERGADTVVIFRPVTRPRRVRHEGQAVLPFAKPR